MRMLVSVLLALSLVSASEDLLSDYLRVKSRESVGTEKAADFWEAQAKKENWISRSWTLDPDRKCIHWVAYLPASEADPLSPILLLHNATTPDRENAFDNRPLEWQQGKSDWTMEGEGVLRNKLQGILHWSALKELAGIHRSRDIFFLMTCSSPKKPELGISSFANFFMRKVPEIQIELSTVEKVETALLIEAFHKLYETEFIWMEGPSGQTQRYGDLQLLRVATAEKGEWSGDLRPETESSKPVFEDVDFERALKNLNAENYSWKQKFHSLHTEMNSWVESIRSSLPWWEWLISLVRPRIFFETEGLENWVKSEWQIGQPTRDENSHWFLPLTYRYLGEKTPFEIESFLQKDFGRFGLKVIKKSYYPFRRNFFEGVESDIIRSEVRKFPNVRITPIIASEPSEGRVLRSLGFRAYGFTPIFLTPTEEAAILQGTEILRRDEFTRALKIETDILKALVQ